MDDYREAVPIEPLAQPVYPPHALAAKAGRMTVGVKITVDENGRVTDVVPSLLTLTTPGRFGDDFMAAIATAVRQWRFRPAQVEHVELVQNGSTAYSRVLHSEATDTHFDLAFTFTATGEVVSAPGK